jgi:hypothetical protein
MSISEGDLAVAAGSLDLLVKWVLPSWSVTESSLRGEGPNPQRAEVRLPAALALYPADLATVQKLAGHSDSATTARYHRCGERAMREAASHLHVPHCFGDEHSEKEGARTLRTVGRGAKEPTSHEQYRIVCKVMKISSVLG